MLPLPHSTSLIVISYLIFAVIGIPTPYMIGANKRDRSTKGHSGNSYPAICPLEWFLSESRAFFRWGWTLGLLDTRSFKIFPCKGLDVPLGSTRVFGVQAHLLIASNHRILGRGGVGRWYCSSRRRNGWDIPVLLGKASNENLKIDEASQVIAIRRDLLWNVLDFSYCFWWCCRILASNTQFNY